MSDKTDKEDFLSILYHALRTRRRREVIRLIHTTDTPTLSVRFLAREIAVAEHELSRTQATGERIETCTTHCLRVIFRHLRTLGSSSMTPSAKPLLGGQISCLRLFSLQSVILRSRHSKIVNQRTAPIHCSPTQSAIE